MKAIMATLATVAVAGFLLGSATAQGIPEWFPLTFTAELADEDSEAIGTITAVLTNGQLVVTGSLDGAGRSGGMAIFEGAEGEPGSRVELTAVPGSLMNGDLIALPSPATRGAVSAVFDLTDEQIDVLRAGRWEVRVLGNFNRLRAQGRLAPVIDLSRVEVDPDAVEIAADDFPGVWIAQGDSWGFQYYENGTWTYLDGVFEAGSPAEPGRNWRLRDTILIQDNRMYGQGTCAGHHIWYLEASADGSLAMNAVWAPPGCGGGDWVYERVEP